jgi:hypothetical protein
MTLDQLKQARLNVLARQGDFYSPEQARWILADNRLEHCIVLPGPVAPRERESRDRWNQITSERT